MDIAELISSEEIVPSLRVSSKKQALQELSKRAAELTGQPERAIFVVFESLYSMDSDSPDLAALVQACREHGAISIIDVAHDFGAMGSRGLGELEAFTFGSVSHEVARDAPASVISVHAGPSA